MRKVKQNISSMESRDDNSVLSESGLTPVLTLGPIKVVRVSQFLPGHERDAIYDAACADRCAFQAPQGTDANDTPTRYLPLDLNGSDEAGGTAVREASRFLSRRILSLLPALFTALEVTPFPVSKIPLTLINGLDGHGGSPHADSVDGRYKISLLYYFHRVPKVFRGGDLELFETSAQSPTGHSDDPLTRVDLEDNLLIAFTSETFHAVTDVHCESSDFADGRFVAVGFVGPQ